MKNYLVTGGLSSLVESYNNLNYASTSNIQEVMKFYILDDKFNEAICTKND